MIGATRSGDCLGAGQARNPVLRYLTSPEAMLSKPRSPRESKLDPYPEYINRRLAEGLENCVVLLLKNRLTHRCGNNPTTPARIKTDGVGSGI